MCDKRKLLAQNRLGSQRFNLTKNSEKESCIFEKVKGQNSLDLSF